MNVFDGGFERIAIGYTDCAKSGADRTNFGFGGINFRAGRTEKSFEFSRIIFFRKFGDSIRNSGVIVIKSFDKITKSFYYPVNLLFDYFLLSSQKLCFPLGFLGFKLGFLFLDASLKLFSFFL